MAKTAVTLGIDIGGTNTKLGLVNNAGRCVISKSIPTYAEENLDTFLDHLFKTVEEITEPVAEHFEIKAVGIGAPNANFYSGCIEEAPNLKWGKLVPLVEIVEEKIKLPTVLTNDANAAAIGEMLFGVAKGMKNFIVITLGTGLGSGIVVNGELVYGHDGFAGELGHVTVIPEGRDHTTGLKGSLETYVSATGIKRTVFELLSLRIHPSRLREVSFNNLVAKDIATAAQEGDLIATEAFEYTGKILGVALANSVAHLSPEAIILFGGLANAGDLLLDPTKKHFEKNLLHIFRNKVKITLSDLKGDNTAVLGAGALAWKNFEG